MSELVFDKKIDGVLEIRDESDRHDPVRIVIDLKKGANRDVILNYFYKIVTCRSIITTTW